MPKNSIWLALTFAFIVPLNLWAKDFEWTRVEGTDKFGDPDGTYRYQFTTFGEGTNSIGSTSTQFVGILYYMPKSRIGIALKDTSSFSMPLNMLFMGPESITLYVKDSTGKTYTFKGQQISDSGGVVIAMNDNGLLPLLRQKGTYKAVVEGDRWECSFSFDGGMPQ